MNTTHWLWETGALVMLGAAALSLGHLVAGALRRRTVAWEAELLHLGMGLCMAGMLDSRLTIVPGPAWLVLFGLGGTWFAWRFIATARRHVSRQIVGHGVVHVGGCAAMAYMLLVVPPNPGMPAMANLICGARMLGMSAAAPGTTITPWTVVALALGTVLLAGAACLPQRWRPPRLGPGPGGTQALRALSPSRLAVPAQVAMCLTMTVTLVALYR